MKFSPLRVATGLFLIVCCAIPACLQQQITLGQVLGELFGFAVLGASFSGGFGVQDNNYSQTLALPSAANTTVTANTSLDTEASSIADFIAYCELLLTAPALNTTQLPNAATMTYNVVASANSNLAGAVVITGGQSVIVQTGAGGAGAAAATGRIRLPSNIGATGRYIGLQEVGAVTNGNCAAASGKLQMLF